MTKDDFDLIICESCYQVTKQTYFEATRIKYNCIPKEYARELLKAFKRLENEVQNTNLNNVSQKYDVFLCDYEGNKYSANEIEESINEIWRDLNAYVQSIDSGTNTSGQDNKLTLNQIALKYVYEGKSITRDNGNEIAKLHGYNSGEKLFQLYTFFSSPTNRKAKPTTCTPKKMKNKIELFESVINILPESNKSRAEDELNILKKIYEAEYQ